MTPNPNVVYELGYARRALGDEHIIMVMNTAYGAQPDLPFDLRQHRAIGYYLPKGIDDESLSRLDTRKNLENSLKEHILAILKIDEPQPVEVVSFADKAMVAIRERHPDEPARVREYMADLTAKIPLISPTNANDILDEQLVQAINASIDIVIEFAQIVKIIAEMNVVEAAKAVYEGFAEILNLYTVPQGQQRRDDTFIHDLARFLGYELFVMFVALLIRNKRWELIATLLDEELFARTHNFAVPEFVPFSSLCQPVALLHHRNERLGWHKRSLQGNLLHERHLEIDLAKFVSAEQFMETDFFLFLRSSLKPEVLPDWIEWRAWTTVFMEKPTRFLQESVRVDFAQQLARSLGLPDIPALRSRVTERRNALINMWTVGFNSPWLDPLGRFDISNIGSS